MALTLTTTAKTELVIEPGLKRMLLTSLHKLQALETQVAALEEQMNEERTTITAIREELGVEKVAIDGFTCAKPNPGTYTVLDKKKLVQLGCAMAWIEEATETRVKQSRTPYDRITCPGGRKRASHED